MSSACLHDAAFGGGPVLDQDTIDGLIELGGGDDPSLLIELVDLFLEDGAERVEKILAACEPQDLETIEKMAHALKSASANIGAISFSEACRDLESCARSAEASQVKLGVEKTRSMFAEVCSALSNLKSAHNS